MKMKRIEIGPVAVGGDAALAVIAGPCLAESRELCLRVGEAMRDRCAALGMGYIFKASFDKANRSSLSSDRGVGMDEGLEILARVKATLGVPVTSDVHESWQCPAAAEVLDLIQIPAFLCRQTDLLVAAAKTGRAVNVKKGQFLSPQEMAQVVGKVAGVGGEQTRLMLTERGTFFGYNRLVNDFVGLGDMMELGWPVCFDVTHSTQQPGGLGERSGGRPERAGLLMRAAVAAGVQALFIETHPQPSEARSDAATMLGLDEAAGLLGEAARLYGCVRGG